MARDDFDIVDQKPIGRGQFGTVFRARRRSDGRIAALKLILHDGENGASTIAAERHGAILQQRVRVALRHGAGGVRVRRRRRRLLHRDGAGRGPVARRAAARRSRCPATKPSSHALWLCEFLDRAHAFSVTVEQRPYRLLHNDLKPAHLKIPDSGERKVLDFGIAKVLEETRELATDVGRTIAYAAPERLRSERVNVHADFWSLGVMLYEMVSGHRPYPELEDPRLRRQLYSAITSNAPRAPLPPDCPLHLQAIVHRLLAFQPAHRYQTAAEIKDGPRAVRPLRTASRASAYYDTPATTPVSRTAGVAVAAARAGGAHGAAGAVLAPVPMTDPVPHTDPVPATDPVPPTDPVRPSPSSRPLRCRRRRRGARRSLPRRLAGAIGRHRGSRDRRDRRRRVALRGALPRHDPGDRRTDRDRQPRRVRRGRTLVPARPGSRASGESAADHGAARHRRSGHRRLPARGADDGPGGVAAGAGGVRLGARAVAARQQPAVEAAHRRRPRPPPGGAAGAAAERRHGAERRRPVPRRRRRRSRRPSIRTSGWR